MYLRFVLPSVDPDSGRKLGFLVAAHELRDGDTLTSAEHALVRELCSWFNEHLRIPSLLDGADQARALSWFKASANKPIARAWELVAVMEAHGINTELLKTVDPGIILYEDKWQVVAKPRRGSKVPW